MVDPDYFKSKEEKEFEKKSDRTELGESLKRDQVIIMFFTFLFYAAGIILLFIAFYKILAR